MDSKELALLCRECAENRKGEDLVILDMRKVTSITDYFVVCTGTSDPHLRAIVSEITERLEADHGIKPRARDGVGLASWVVVDFTDVIVHVMKPEIRAHYDLEGLWGDAPRLRKPRAKPKKIGR